MFEIHVNKVRRIDRRAVDDGAISIGRSSSNDIVLPSSAVSRRHCVIETQDGISRIVDCESHHGTFVNGARIHEPHVLETGDVIDVGRFQMTFAGQGDLLGGGADDSVAHAEDEAHQTRGVALDDGITIARDETESAEQAAALAAAESDMAERRADLDGREATLMEQGAALDEREATLTERVSILDERETTLTERVSVLDEREASIGPKIEALEKLEAALAAHDLVLSERDQAMEERESAAGEGDQALLAREEELARQQASLAERERDIEERTALVEQRDQLERQLAEREDEAARLASTAERRQGELDAAMNREAKATERIGKLEKAYEEAVHEGDAAGRSLQDTHAAAVRLFRTARRVDDARRMLPTLEELWFESDRSVEEAEDDGPEALEQASMHRESVARRLENTHAELDAALGGLQAELDRFEENIEIEPLDAADLRARRFRILPALRRRLHRSV